MRFSPLFTKYHLVCSDHIAVSRVILHNFPGPHITESPEAFFSISGYSAKTWQWQKASLAFHTQGPISHYCCCCFCFSFMSSWVVSVISVYHRNKNYLYCYWIPCSTDSQLSLGYLICVKDTVSSLTVSGNPGMSGTSICVLLLL